MDDLKKSFEWSLIVGLATGLFGMLLSKGFLHLGPIEQILFFLLIWPIKLFLGLDSWLLGGILAEKVQLPWIYIIPQFAIYFVVILFLRVATKRTLKMRR